MKRNKFLTIILVIAICSGVLCSGIIIASGIQKGSSASARTGSHEREKYPNPHILEKTRLDSFSQASIHLDQANVSILPADDFYLEYRLDGTCQEPDYEVSGQTFYFQEGSTQHPYTISFHLFGNPVNQEPFYLNLYVPADQYFELLTMDVESGNVKLKQINAREADLTLAYGDLDLDTFTGTTLNLTSESGNISSETITCEDLTVSAAYGNFTGDTVSVSGNSNFDLESGDLNISSLTTGDFKADSTYGNCSLEHITAKALSCSLDSGNLTLKNAVLEHGEINAEYGDVTIELADQASDYSYDLKAEYGTVTIDEKNIREDEDGTVVYLSKDGKKEKSIQIWCSSGNVDIR